MKNIIFPSINSDYIGHGIFQVFNANMIYVLWTKFLVSITLICIELLINLR